jgi:uncharacterized cupredoxin-like copper-binding protein
VGAGQGRDAWFPARGRRLVPDDPGRRASEHGATVQQADQKDDPMSVTHEPPPPTESSPGAPRPGAEDPTAAALAGIRQELREQGRRIRSTQQAFSIFAVMALLIALASLLAVAFKLDRKQHVVTVAAPAGAVRARAAAPPLARNVDVTLAQFAVTPSDSVAPAGKVTFRVHNAGTIVHEFVVIRSPRPAADLPLSNGRADESGNVGETGDLKPGTTKSVSLDLAAGHYALICNLPGHYLAGQHTDFVVR